MGGLITTGQIIPQLRHLTRRCFSGRPEQGFTIVEVLIVLAVSALLFASAAFLIAGKQNQTAFNQSIQQIQSQIQQIMNEVAIGYYPNNSDFQCTATAAGPTFTTVVTNQQGTNSGCVFVGKAMQFRVQGSDPEIIAVYPLAGLQKDSSSGQEVQNISQAKPKIVQPAAGQFSVKDVILQNGLTTLANGGAVNGMWYDNGVAKVPIGAIAFVTSFPQAGASGSGLSSGSQQMDVIPIDSSTTNSTEATGVAAINGHIADSINVGPSKSPPNPTKGVSICFVSGGTNQSGLITIGGNNHPLSVTLSIINGSKIC